MAYSRAITASFLIFSSLLAISSKGQTNASPYSMVGIGDINYNTYDRSSGMGGAGISLASNRYLLNANPASVAYLDDHYFTGEVSANYKGVYYADQYKANGKQLNSKDLQFQRLAFGLKPKSFWGTSFGIRQYSSVNYSYNYNKNVQNSTITAATNVNGEGGLNQVFWSNAVRIGRHFSLGLESSYLFGSKQEEQTISATSISSQYNVPYTTYYNHLYFKAGAQYHGLIRKDLLLNVGAVAAKKTTLNGSRSLDITEGDASVGTILTTIVKDMSLGYVDYTLPTTYGGGLSLRYKGKYTVAADYQRQEWDKAGNASQYGARMVNSQRWSGGFEYANMQTEIIDNMLYSYEKSYFQLGGYYNQGNLMIRGQQISDYGVTFGVGFNPRSSRTSLGSQLGYLINFSVGSRGTRKNNLIKENFYQIGLVLSYRDFWRSSKQGIYN